MSDIHGQTIRQAGVRVSQVTREVPYLLPGDSVARAISLMHRHSLPGLAVLQDGQPVAVLLERDLLHHEDAPATEMDWEVLRGKCVTEVPLHPAPAVLRTMPLNDAAQLMKDSGLPCVPVLSEAGYYTGLVCRRDTVAGLLRIASPGSIGGMATPFGVYLTNGVVRAGGRGNLGLALTGATMVLMWTVTSALLGVLAWAGQQVTGIPLLAFHNGFFSQSTALYVRNPGLWMGVFFILQLVLFFVLMRLTPLSAIHGAEHQVVHTIEAGEELTPEAVAAHTPVHPRCGTNLAAMMLVIFAGAYFFVSAGSTDLSQVAFGVSAVTLGALIFRNRVGGLLQALLTTRRPPRDIIVAAIQVGNEILEKSRFQEPRSGTPWLRIWNMGLIQVMAGAGVTMMLLDQLQKAVGSRGLLG